MVNLGIFEIISFYFMLLFGIYNRNYYYSVFKQEYNF